MGLELRLAWRNVWRNPRRTWLTIAATVFAVFLVVFFVAMGAGLHEKMIEDSVRVHSGHLTVTGRGYLEHKTLEYGLVWDDSLLAVLEGEPAVQGIAPRVTGFGLLSKTAKAQGVMVMGVDPDREGTVSTLPERVREGRFLTGETSREIVLGSRLAENLGAVPGDELLLYSVAYSLEMAYELFTVVGIMRLPEPSLDRRFAVVDLADAQEFFVYGDLVTEVALLTSSAEAAAPLAERLRRELPDPPERPLAVHTWDEVLPELEQLILLDDAQMYITLAILMMVVAFGILNTILMAVLERTRELGVLLALGFRPAAIFRLIYFESLMLAGVGLVIGLALAIPTVFWFEANPIWLESESMTVMIETFGMEPVMMWKFKITNPIGSAATILGIAGLAALYPAWKASRARPVDALRAV
jgi:ABC-type lipoprotein release transport system permease subunit